MDRSTNNAYGRLENIENSSSKNKYFFSLFKKLLIIQFCQDFMNLMKIKELSKNTSEALVNA